MAFPTVSSVTVSVFNTAATSHLVAMPATVSAGDLLVTVGSGQAGVFTTPASFTLLHQTQNGSGAVLGAWYRIADGSEGGTTVDWTTPVNRKGNFHVYRITAWHGTTPPEVGTAATGSSTTPDSPTLTPSWGSADTLWIASEGNSGATTVSAYPTNYTNGNDDQCTGAGGNSLGTARRELAASSEDPAAFTISVTNIWVAQTIAIRPGAGAATVTPAVVPTVTTVPTPTVLASANVTPAVVPLSFTVPTPTVIAAANVAPAVVAAVTTVPTPTIAAGAVAAVLTTVWVTEATTGKAI